MSIVGTQSVSMSDLMKLGPQALGAMAQGQMQSIAPSYMVIAALKALTDQQRGTGAQVPQGTVKDQVLAQAAPPAQAGIGAMQPPVKGFSGADGESQVKSDRKKLMNIWEGVGDVGSAVADVGMLIPRGLMGAYNSSVVRAMRAAGLPAEYIPDVAGGDYSSMTPFYDERVRTKATAPTTAVNKEATKPVGAPVERTEGGRGKVNPPTIAEMSKAESEITAPAAVRGIGSTGVNPLAKYAPAKLGEYEKMGELAKPDQYKLDIPKNEQLIAAAEKFSKPDEARMKELRDAEGRAGLAAFARGMMNTKNGIGVGAAFGPAAADSIDAKEAKAEKRREYEDRREALATELGVRVGAEAKADYLANSKWGAERADATNQQAIRVLQAQNEATRFGNAEILDREKMAMTERIAAQSAAIQREANRLQAEIRKDGVDQQKFQRLLNTQQVAADNARKLAETKVGKPDDPMNRMNPDFQRRFNFEYKQAYESTFPPALEAVLQQGLGIGATAQPQQAAPGKVVRGRL